MSQDNNEIPSSPEIIPDATFAEPIGTTAISTASNLVDAIAKPDELPAEFIAKAAAELADVVLPLTPDAISDPKVETATEVQEEQIASTPYPDLPVPFENKNTVQEYECTREEGLVLQPLDEHMNLAALPIKDILTLSDKMPELSENDTEQSNNYIQTIQNGVQAIPPTERYTNTLGRQEAEWRQYLGTEKGKMGFSVPKFAEKDATKVSGERALLRIAALMGKGSIISIPLWHSGFWITLRTPSDSALLELRRRLMDDKVRLGRETQGLVFSNTKSYTTGWLLDMCMAHFYDCTLKDQTDVRSKIQTPDLDILFWGLACAIWPNGFQFSRAILTDDAVKTKEIVQGKINIAKLMWPDNSRFSKHQKAHMSNRVPSSMDDDSIKRYLDDFPLYKGRKVDINENISVIINVPTADAFVANGMRWVSDVVTMVDRTFTADVEHADSRRIAINENALATLLRQYSHWIECVVVEEVEHRDRETIDSSLEMFSSEVEVRNKIIKSVGEYIDDITVAVIAIPESSGKETGLPRFPRLIPLDVTATFFTLLMQRINRLLSS